MHRYRFPPCFAVVAPDLVHKLYAGEYLSGVGEELVQKQKLLLRQGDCLTAAGHAHIVVAYRNIAYLYFPFADDLRTAQKCLYPKKHLFFIDRLCHIVVGTHKKALALVLGELLCRDHQNRQVIIRVPQSFRQLVTVHFRHHYIKDYQVYMFAVKLFQRIRAVFRRYDIIPCALENFFDKPARVLIIIDCKYIYHLFLHI